MKTLFKLSLVTAVRQKTVFVLLLLLVLGPFVFQQMTNFVADPNVIAPARAQAAWQFSWAGIVLWLSYQAANLGGEHVRNKMGEYFLSRGEGKSSQMLALSFCSLVFAVAISIIPVLVSIFAAAPSDLAEFKHWVVLCIQHVVLMLLLAMPVTQFAIALASRFGALVGYTGAVLLYFLGFYAVLAVEKIVMAEDVFHMDLLYVILPHYYLADVTHRFVHAQGAMTNMEFFAVFEYLAGWGVLLSAVSYFIFTPKKK